MNDLNILDMFDHQSAYQQFWQLRSLQARFLAPDGDSDLAAQCDTRAIALTQPAAAYLDDMLLLLDAVTGKALEQAYRDLLDSGQLIDGSAGYISTRLFVRDDIVDVCRTQFETARSQITGMGVAEFVSADALLGAGATLVAGGLASAAVVATAPVTVPAAVIGGGLLLAGAAVVTGGIFVVSALSQ